MADVLRPPRVWINVSTSANWNRPAVGIVRVERALAAQLVEIMGTDICRLCLWQDDRFVEWAPPAASRSVDDDRVLDAFVPRGPSFDLVRPFIGRALRRYGIKGISTEASETVRIEIPLKVKVVLEPAPGDFLISVGLDWDMPYSARFHAIAAQQGLRIITCCYDLIPVLFPHYCVGEVSKRFTEYFLDLSWGSEAVLCISEQTQRDYTDLCARLGAPMRKSVVIPLGDSIPSGKPEVSDEVMAASKRPFILFVSTIERRKNHEVLYRAYHLLAKQRRLASIPTLVFVGMHGWGVEDLMKDIRFDPLVRNLIVELNQVSDGELGHLYRKALFCVYPSLYEGWGLPVGEALAMGKAVIASGEGSLPEVGGDLVRYVPAWNPYAWADAISEYVSNPAAVADAEYRVQSEYKPRQWVDMAVKVKDLIYELSGKHIDNRTFLPGYQLSTFCGIHEGPAIAAIGTSGLLMFGPHIAITAGTYDVVVTVDVSVAANASLQLSVVSGGARVVHATLTHSLHRAEGLSALSMHLDIGMDVLDLEIKCEMEGRGQLRIERVEILRIAAEQHNALRAGIAASAALVMHPDKYQP